MSYPTDFPVDEVIKGMHQQAGEGLLLVAVVAVKQETKSGLVLAPSIGDTGEDHGIVLDIGPVQVRDGSVEAALPYKVGDLITFAKGHARGVFDFGLDKTVVVVGQKNVMTIVPREIWDSSKGTTLAAEYRRDLVA